MATYRNITKEEMAAFLERQGFSLIGNLVDLPNTKELVWGKRIPFRRSPMTLRVFSGITRSGGSRGVGKDAIRVQLAIRIDDGKTMTIGSSRRVHRVAGWKANLQERIDHWMDQVGPDCPKCGSLMVEREGRFGRFWACTLYPGCKGGINITNQEKKAARKLANQASGTQRRPRTSRRERPNNQ